MLNLLLGHDLKARKLGDAKGGRHRGVRGVTTASHDNAADAGMVVTRVYRVPTAIEKDFGPGAEIHGIGINRNADVAELAGAIPRGNVHAGGARIRITEADLRVHEIANRLHTLAAAQYHPEMRPGEISELVAVAIPALE
jgi:hypothetical protein